MQLQYLYSIGNNERPVKGGLLANEINETGKAELHEWPNTPQSLLSSRS